KNRSGIAISRGGQPMASLAEFALQLHPANGSNGQILFLCDLDSGTARNIPVRGEPKGWWSDREIVVETGGNTFELLDVETQTNRTLFSPEDISGFLAEAGLKNPTAILDAFANW